MSLILEPNMTDSDEFYAVLTDLHRQLNPEESQRVNARLILFLANHIGDREVLMDAMERASRLDTDPDIDTESSI